MDINQF